jgi:hypothetical protein
MEGTVWPYPSIAAASVVPSAESATATTARPLLSGGSSPSPTLTRDSTGAAWSTAGTARGDWWKRRHGHFPKVGTVDNPNCGGHRARISRNSFLTPGLGTLVTLRRRRQLPRNRVPHPTSKGCSSVSGALVMCETPQKHLVRKCSLFERREARRPTRAGRRAKLPASEHCSNSSSFNEVQKRHV